ncbi:MAG: hypothetical protein U0X20_27510 [Caldilineaceae bacterium]
MTPAEQNELTLLRMEVQRLTVKAVSAQNENRRLRKLTANGRTGRLLERTAADARQLCAWRWAGFSVSRGAAHSYGMSRRRWHWAVSLLERARVVKPDAKYLDDAFEVDDLADAIDAIDRTVKVLQQAGLASLEMRMPRNGYAGRKSSR